MLNDSAILEEGRIQTYVEDMSTEFQTVAFYHSQCVPPIQDFKPLSPKQAIQKVAHRSGTTPT